MMVRSTINNDERQNEKAKIAIVTIADKPKSHRFTAFPSHLSALPIVPSFRRL
jgi:hypothetical protein